jgi:hypothetical protein
MVRCTNAFCWLVEKASFYILNHRTFAMQIARGVPRGVHSKPPRHSFSHDRLAGDPGEREDNRGAAVPADWRRPELELGRFGFVDEVRLREELSSLESQHRLESQGRVEAAL